MIAVTDVPVDHASARAAGPPQVAVEGLTHRFGDRVALDDVSLAVPAGAIVALVGPSGSGKSTLLRLIAGIDAPTRGAIRLAGDLVAGPGVFVPAERRRIGMVFQDYALFPHLSVAANIAFGLRGQPRDRVDDTVRTLLDRVHLPGAAASYPHTLSGGERQRVALARALAPAPRVLLMDEPFSSLDVELRAQIRQDTVDLLRQLHTTTIVVTHDAAEAAAMADRVAILRGGRLQS